ncbi:sensor histidine kinase [Cognatiyoonia sp.]|uniref:sensor histidine kinase n=1 Tax=Cognatiyoonia sp. TaxID=2211652 RepID=UPI003F698E02
MPLTFVQGAAELLANPDLPEANRKQTVGYITEASESMTSLLDAQRVLAHANEPLPVGKCRFSEVLPEANDVVFAWDGVIPLSQTAFEPVAKHLISNARQHGASQITFSVSNNMLTVSDNGAGISPGNRNHVFDPFFTTMRDSRGTGMGLPIVRQMLEAQGASIEILDEKNTIFAIKS